MSSFAYNLAGFMSTSLLGSATQIVKGKILAVFLGAVRVGVFNQLMLFYNWAMTLSSLCFRNGITRNIAVAVAETGDPGVTEEGVFVSSRPLSYWLPQCL